jgi:hypothetical protein
MANSEKAEETRVIITGVDMSLDSMILLALKVGLALGVASLVAGLIAAAGIAVLGISFR